MKPGGAQHEVTEVFSGDDDGLLWLTLGFTSPDPHDVLHIACGKTATGVAGEDELYLERTDQDLACSGQVLALAAGEGCIALSLTPEGASSLKLGEHTCFTFNEHPALLALARVQLAQMRASGQACITIQLDQEGTPGHVG